MLGEDYVVVTDPVASTGRSASVDGKGEPEVPCPEETLNDTDDEDGLDIDEQRASKMKIAAKAASEVPLEVVTNLEKPQIWLRLHPSEIDTDVYEILEDQKTLVLTVKPDDKLFLKKSPNTARFACASEGILQGTQDEVYAKVAKETVDNAMAGASGVITLVGPDKSGKSFTLFGAEGKYQDRGIVFRALEDIFAIVEKPPNSLEYHIILSMFEIRRDKMRDLMTLSPRELTRVGEFGPKGLFFEEMLSVEHAFNRVLRGIAGQQLMPKESYARSHTVVYIDILARNNDPNPDPNIPDGSAWRSRLTFVEIASFSKEAEMSEASASDVCQPLPDPRSNSGEIIVSKKDLCYATDGINRRCCGGPKGPMAEMISIKKDMSFLEQMFTKTYNMQKLHEYYKELRRMGMYMLAKQPPFNTSQCFRLSKLTYCLKDIVSGVATVRVVVHIIPQKPYLQTTLELLRISEQARLLSYEIPRKIPEPPPNATNNEDKTTQACPEPQDGQKLNTAFQSTVTYFEEKLERMKQGTCKEQLKKIFEGFKDMWAATTQPPPTPEAGGKDAESGEMAHTGGEGDVPSVSPSTADIREDGSDPKRSPRGRSKNVKQSVMGEDRERSKSKKGNKGRLSISATASKSKIGLTKSLNRRESTLSKASVIPDSEDEEFSKEGAEETVTSSFPIPETLTPGTPEALEFKKNCWKAFTKSGHGAPAVLASFAEKQAQLKTTITEHNETLKEAVDCLLNLVNLELDLDKQEQDRIFQDVVDEATHTVRHSVLEQSAAQKVEGALEIQREFHAKLENCRKQIQDEVTALVNYKIDCEKQFGEFCVHKFGKSPDFSNLPLGVFQHSLVAIAEELPGFPTVQIPEEIIHPPPEEDAEALEHETEMDTATLAELEKRFAELTRVAKQEAQAILKGMYPKRPAWAD